MKAAALLVGLAAGLALAVAVGYIQIFVDAATTGLSVDLSGFIVAIGDRYPPWIPLLVVVGLTFGGAILVARVAAPCRKWALAGFAVGLALAIVVGWVLAGQTAESPISPKDGSLRGLIIEASVSQAVYLMLGASLVAVWNQRRLSAKKSSRGEESLQAEQFD